MRVQQPFWRRGGGSVIGASGINDEGKEGAYLSFSRFVERLGASRQGGGFVDKTIELLPTFKNRLDRLVLQNKKNNGHNQFLEHKSSSKVERRH